MSQPDLVLLHAPSVYDFRKKSILYGPVSDLVPSTPVFELYPIGFTTLAEYLERQGYRVRIANLAVRMLNERRFDPEQFLRALKPHAFGIDLHWMPHAQGAFEVARLVKRLHPGTPVIFGGFSSSYFHEELAARPEIDYILRGDSTEEPLRQLMDCLRTGQGFETVPNLTWRDASGQVRVNPLTYSPDNLDHVLLDYSHIVKAVARYRDLASYVPFRHWLDYPITAALTCRGCTHNCKTCGGSATAFREIQNRQRPAYRDPVTLAKDIRSIGRFSKGPVFILGDLRQPGKDYADRFLEALGVLKQQVIIEVFDAAGREFFQKIAAAMPNFTLEISLESHSEEVRRAFGRPYSNAAIEATMEYALEAGCQRLDIFFMIGLPRQDHQSVMDTIDYCEYLMKRFNRSNDRRLIPFISPLAPFVDPGSAVFEHPEKHGYRLFHRTFEEHRQALTQPSWKYILNYETEWMTRDQIVDSTYEAGLRLNRLKAHYGLTDPAQAAVTEERIIRARRLIVQIDDIMSIPDESRREKLLAAMKPQIDNANLSTVCEKSELELPIGWLKLNIPEASWFLAQTGWRKLRTALQRR
jgi:B12-binding domain/radical SAM domain protein